MGLASSRNSRSNYFGVMGMLGFDMCVRECVSHREFV